MNSITKNTFLILGFICYSIFLFGQSCDCQNFLYVNDPTFDLTHKFEINPDGSVGDEIGNTWIASEVINNPHGVAPDINGKLYVAQIDQPGDAAPNQLFQVDCDGNVLNTDYIPGWEQTFNIQTIGNTLYYTNALAVKAYDICTKALIGQLDIYPSLGIGANWGLSKGLDGKLYASTSWGGIGANHTILRIEPDLSTYTTVVSIPNTDATQFVLGVAHDEHGNIYFIRTSGSGGGATTIYKTDANGNIIHSITDAVNNGQGYYGAWGIVYNEDTGKLYVSTLLEDCIAVFDTGGASGSMTYQSALGIPHTPGGYTKAINILKECCPNPSNVTIDTILCGATLNQKIFLQDLINCDGTICEGGWVEGVGNAGMTFDPCESSVTITDTEQACGSFTLGSDGTGNNPQCGAFELILNIETLVMSGATIAGNQTICPGTVPVTLTSNASSPSGAVSYQWQQSTTFCSAGFTNIPGATSSTYTPEALSVETHFRLIASVDGNCSSGNCSDITDCVTIMMDPNCVCRIGNFVWEDTNGNGLQNGDEPGIDGVQIELLKNNVLIASTETANDGAYSFSSISDTDANLNWIGTGVDTALIDNTTYVIRIRDAEGSSQQNVLNQMVLTNIDANNNNSDDMDSDATLNFPDAEITATTGDPGCLDESFDFGFIPCPVLYAEGANTSLCNGNDGNIILILTNVPDGNYTIDYEDGSSSAQTFTNVSVFNGEATIDNLSAGAYNNISITVNDCASSDGNAVVDVILTDPALPTISATGTDPSMCNLQDGSIAFIFSNVPDGSYDISYEDGSGTAQIFSSVNVLNNEVTINNLGAGAYYNLSITSNDCISTEHVDVDLIETCNFDFGDLPDTDSLTSTGNYQTNLNNNGPRHLIIAGLYLGNEIDFETDGQASSMADGDDSNGVNGIVDEDGLTFPNSMQIAPGGILNIPLLVTNTTGNTAHLEMWMDWNNDGDFDDDNEMVANFDDAVNAFPAYIFVAIPQNAASMIGVRIRLSNQDNMTPYGLVESGEVEDYLIQVNCEPFCMPIKSILVKND